MENYNYYCIDLDCYLVSRTLATLTAIIMIVNSTEGQGEFLHKTLSNVCAE